MLALFQIFYTSSFWSLAVCKNRGRRPGRSYHVICGMADVMDSRHNSLFTYLIHE